MLSKKVFSFWEINGSISKPCFCKVCMTFFHSICFLCPSFGQQSSDFFSCITSSWCQCQTSSLANVVQEKVLQKRNTDTNTRWVRNRKNIFLFSGSNIPSPNQFFDKVFFFFSFRWKCLCSTTRKMIFEKFTICTLQ